MTFAKTSPSTEKLLAISLLAACVVGLVIGLTTPYMLASLSVGKTLLIWFAILLVAATLVKPYLGPLAILYIAFLFGEETGITASELLLYILLFSSLFAVLLKVFRNPILFLPEEPIGKPLFAFIAISVIGIQVGLLNNNSFYHLFSETARILFYSLFFLIIIFFSWKQIYSALIGLGIIAIYLSADTYYRFLNHLGSRYMVDGEIIYRSLGSFLPQYLLPICLAIILYAKPWKLRFSLTLLALFLMGGMVLSFTRSLWVGTFASIAMLIYIFSSEKTIIGKVILKRASLSILIILLISILLATSSLTARSVIYHFWKRVFLSSGKIETERGIQSRLIENRIVCELIEEKPLFGYGWGARYKSYPFYMAFSPSMVRETATVHNGFLYIAYKLGLVGLAIFVWLLLSAVRFGIKVFRLSKDFPYRPLAAGFTASLVGFAVTSFFSSRFHYFADISFLVFIMSALAILGERIGSANKKVDRILS